MPELVAMPQITALYAGLLGLLAVVLSILVGRYRGPSADRRVSIGDGGRPEVLVAMRSRSRQGSPRGGSRRPVSHFLHSEAWTLEKKCFPGRAAQDPTQYTRPARAG